MCTWTIAHILLLFALCAADQLQWETIHTALTNQWLPGRKRACGSIPDSQKVTILGDDKYSTFSADTGSYSAKYINDGLSIGTNHQGQSFAQLGDSIFFMISNRLGSFDMEFATRQWQASTIRFSAQGPRCCLAVSEDERYIFVTGGATDGAHTKMDVFEIYDVENDTLIEGPPLLRTTANHACALKGSTLYVIGGDDGTDSHSQVQVIDVSDPANLDMNGATWADLGCRLQQARNHLRAFVLGDSIYAVGGSGTMVDRIDTNTGKISIASPAPASMMQMCVAHGGSDEVFVLDNGYVMYRASIDDSISPTPTMLPTSSPTDTPLTCGDQYVGVPIAEYSPLYAYRYQIAIPAVFTSPGYATADLSGTDFNIEMLSVSDTNGNDLAVSDPSSQRSITALIADSRVNETVFFSFATNYGACPGTWDVVIDCSTFSPTTHPTTPTTEPSSAPTNEPSSAPTMEPTQPSSAPTNEPTLSADDEDECTCGDAVDAPYCCDEIDYASACEAECAGYDVSTSCVQDECEVDPVQGPSGTNGATRVSKWTAIASLIAFTLSVE